MDVGGGEPGAVAVKPGAVEHCLVCSCSFAAFSAATASFGSPVLPSGRFMWKWKPPRPLFLKCKPIVVFSLAEAKRAPAQDPPPPGNLPRALGTSPAGFLPLRKVPRTEVPVIVGEQRRESRSAAPRGQTLCLRRVIPHAPLTPPLLQCEPGPLPRASRSWCSGGGQQPQARTASFEECHQLSPAERGW